MKIAHTLACLALAAHLLAQQTNARQLQAHRIDEPIRIDGVLDEPAWQAAEQGSGFTTLRPNPGLPSSEATHVQVLYDERGIYIGATLFDSQPDSILSELTERDNLGNTDFFGLVVDPYESGLNGYTFITSPGNVQFDAQQTAQGEDANWDAVWWSKARKMENGWGVEMLIPYQALRFPKTDMQNWTVNFVRMIRRRNEQSFWDEVDPNMDGFLNQAGTLTGLENLKSPFRLQLTPFITAVGAKQYRPTQNPSRQTAGSLGGGMDLKMGLNAAFTLDMTLIPDFSEARSDNNQLNLGPFEQFFSEQRAFFTEGTELFNKGNLFYSRRIGGRLYDRSALQDLAEGESVVDMPGRAQLINATKVSGRTASGTGLGLFNGIEKRAYATVEDLEGNQRQLQVHPRTNYNVLVVDQNLPNNSSVTLINTNVLREGGAADANVTGLLYDIHDKSNTYSVSGSGQYSQRFMPEETQRGHAMDVSLSKISGNWQYGVTYAEESDTYNPNDLGILFSNNERSLYASMHYNQVKPFLGGFFLNGGGRLFFIHGRLYKPNVRTSNYLSVATYAQAKNFWNINIWADHSLGTQFDYFEPRVPGRFWAISPQSSVGIWMGTDGRKKLRINGNVSYADFSRDAQRHSLDYSIEARYRASDRLSLNSYFFRSSMPGDVGYVDQATRTVIEDGHPIREVTDVFMGRRDRMITEVGLDGKYSFTANMTLNLRVRHYWDRVHYTDFHLLDEEGGLATSEYEQLHDVDFDAFNVDLIYRWRFAPGSDLFLVYKSGISAFSNEVDPSYAKSFSRLWQNTPSTQSLSLKVVYWLDVASVVK